MTAEARLTYTATPKGAAFQVWTRPDVNDEALVMGILGSDEYHLRDLPPLTGWALDIGAHVGTVGIALALDHPGLSSIVMVEPVPQNAALIRRSIEHNGLRDRCTVIEAMAGKGTGTAICRYNYTHLEGFEDQDYVTQNAWVGGIWRLTDDEKVQSESAEVPILTWDGIMAGTFESMPAIVKIDCEGCEWDFLVGCRFPLIVGEVHDASPAEIARVLPKHRIEVLADYGGSGIVRATL